MPLAVVAIGGNSLTLAHQQGTIDQQFENARLTARHLAGIIELGWNVVLTHGNGPQVGNVLTRSELASEAVYPLPMDICDADTQGGIGYMLQQVLGNELRRRQISRSVVTVITQVSVSPTDSAFDEPSKPVGPFFSAEEAAHKQQVRGWIMKEDAGRGWRRVVPSPAPLKIIELDAIRSCVAQGFITIAVGGGGVPVVEDTIGQLRGVEAVIDKDRASALLAGQLDAELLVMSTGIQAVEIDHGTPEARALRDIDRHSMREYLQAGQFPDGSMGPKIESAIDFLDRATRPGIRQVVITDPTHLVDALDGRAGTRIR